MARRFLCLACLPAAAHGLVLAAPPANGTAPAATAPLDFASCAGLGCLQRFVNHDDGAYSWRVAQPPKSGQSQGVRWTSYNLELVSLSWMPRATSTQHWKHSLDIVVPEGLHAGLPGAGLALLLINENRDLAQELAARTGLVTAALSATPPQFLRFGTKTPVFEEKVKAASWAKYASDFSEPWPLELPAAKAVIKAMDAVSESSRGLGGGVPAVEGFALAGWSKRAIAAMMAAEVDSRVRALVAVSHPVDLETVGRDSYRNLGETVDAAKVYDEAGSSRATGVAFKRLEAVVDPGFYLERLSLPKIFMLAGGDDFFPPDSTRSWWGRLPKPASFYLYGNSRHAGFIRPFKDAAVNFLTAFKQGKSLPTLSWSISNSTGDISVQSSQAPMEVKVWSALSTAFGKRDFRGAKYEAASGVAWKVGAKSWVSRMNAPKEGYWRAFFVELAFPSAVPGGPLVRLTTEASVVPLTRPFNAPSWRNYLA